MSSWRKSVASLIVSVLFVAACGNSESAPTDTIAPSRGANASSARSCKVPGKLSRLGGASTVCAQDGKSRSLFTVTKLTSRRCSQSGQLKPQGLDLAVCARSGLLQRWAIVVNPFNTPESSPTNELPPGDDGPAEATEVSSPLAPNPVRTTIPMPELSPIDVIEASTPAKAPINPTRSTIPTSPTTAAAGDSATGANKIKAGFRFACSLVGDGTIACWGENGQGQIGGATFSCTSNCGDFSSFSLTDEPRRESRGFYVSPTGQQLEEITVRTRVPFVTDASALEVGYAAACAIVAGGRLTCWGLLGEWTTTEGKGSTTIVSGPKAIEGLANVRDVAIGKSSACAVLADGSVHCWGNNDRQSLIPGNDNPYLSSPTRVPGVNNASSVTVVSTDVNASYCALLRDSTAKCWSNPQELGLLRKTFADPGRGLRNDDDAPEDRLTGLSNGVHTYGNAIADCSAAEAYFAAAETAYDNWYRALTAAERTLLDGEAPADFQDDSAIQPSPAAQAYYDVMVKISAFLSEWQNAPECEISITPLREIKEIIAPESCFCWGQWELCVTDLSNNLSCASTSFRDSGVDETLLTASAGFRKIEIGRHLNSRRGNVVACWDTTDGELFCNAGLNNSLYPLPDVIATQGFLGSTNLSDHVHVVDFGRPIVDFSLFDMMVCARTDDGFVYCWEKSEFSNYVGKARRYRFS